MVLAETDEQKMNLLDNLFQETYISDICEIHLRQFLDGFNLFFLVQIIVFAQDPKKANTIICKIVLFIVICFVGIFLE